jgi:hypothetical protein
MKQGTTTMTMVVNDVPIDAAGCDVVDSEDVGSGWRG